MKIITKSYVVSAIALLIGVMPSDIALSQQGIFDGMWKASEADGVVLMVEDNGQQINAELYSGGFDHTFQGKHTSNYKANLVVTRTNITDNCVTRMYLTWALINPNQFRYKVTGTDGRCDLPSNYQELRVFNRQ